MTMSRTPVFCRRAGFCLPSSDAYNICPLGAIKVNGFLTRRGGRRLLRSVPFLQDGFRCYIFVKNPEFHVKITFFSTGTACG